MADRDGRVTVMRLRVGGLTPARSHPLPAWRDEGAHVRIEVLSGLSGLASPEHLDQFAGQLHPSGPPLAADLQVLEPASFMTRS